MSRIRATCVLAIATAALFAAAVVAPARAQEAPAGATAPTITVPTTLLPGEPTSTTTSTVPPIDPHADAPAEPVPAVDVTVPPEPDTPKVSRVVRVDARAARAASLTATANLDAAVARRADLEAKVATLSAQVASLDSDAQRAVRELLNARDRLAQRAADAYMRGGRVDDAAFDGADLDAEVLRAALFDQIVHTDDDAIARFKAVQAKANKEQLATAAAVQSLRVQLDQARGDEERAKVDAVAATFAFRVTSAGGDIVINGFVFPVAKPYAPFGDSFGDPRMPGTPQAHAHMGCDVVAAEGTELFAVERGVIMHIASGGLGGNGVWLRGVSGTVYYYAHLSRFVDGQVVGQVLDAGAVLGYVGATGDATGPHLHFEVHPNGGEAINPYPILKAAADL
jgi:murein DD-endopeptidase MepM/ murein hydrolase activator NlpD